MDLSNEFDMKDLGCASKILGMSIKRNRKNNTLAINQKTYLTKVLDTFNMSDAKPNSLLLISGHNLDNKIDDSGEILTNMPYAEAIGSIMYAMVCTRPDIAYFISVLSRYMTKPKLKHWKAIKGLLRYIKGTLDVGLEFGKFTDGIDIIGYSDDDFAKDPEFKRSTTSYILTVCGSCVSCKSKL